MDDVKVKTDALIRNICDDIDVDIVRITVLPEYVHLIIDVDPLMGIHKVVKRIKRETSRTLRDEFSELQTKIPTLWTNSYFVSTVGEVLEADIRDYIDKQKTSQRQ